MKLLRIAVGALILIVPGLVLGAVQRPNLKPSSILRGAGIATGGQAGQTLGLMDIRHTNQAKSSAERIILDFGKSNLQPLNGVVGYYHAELQQSPPRLAVELPLTLGSKVSETEVLKRLSKSRSIKRALITFDRTSQSTNLVLQFKKPMMVRLSQVQSPKAPGKLIVDLMPLEAQTKASARGSQSPSQKVRR